MLAAGTVYRNDRRYNGVVLHVVAAESAGRPARRYRCWHSTGQVDRIAARRIFPSHRQPDQSPEARLLGFGSLPVPRWGRQGRWAYLTWRRGLSVFTPRRLGSHSISRRSGLTRRSGSGRWERLGIHATSGRSGCWRPECRGAWLQPVEARKNWNPCCCRLRASVPGQLAHIQPRLESPVCRAAPRNGCGRGGGRQLTGGTYRGRYRSLRRYGLTRAVSRRHVLALWPAPGTTTRFPGCSDRLS